MNENEMATTSNDIGNAATKNCGACQERIHLNASLCPSCGTRQGKLSRRFFRAVTVLGALATVLSVISAGVALAPQAYSFVWPNPRPNIFEMNFDTRDLNTRQFGVFDLYNGGNRDVFATKLVLEPQGELFENLGDVEISIYETIPAGTAVEHRIALISSANPTPKRARLLIEDQYENLRAYLIERGSFRRDCFALLPMNASKMLRAPEGRRFRHDIASTTMSTYLTVRDDRDLDAVPVQDFHVEAAVYFNELCIAEIGGREVFVAAISGE
ncbi:MAG: hypothetical protein N4A53_03055 [Pelagimonas sp.]|nr:hypothetical protein [Pelagimonas sp.]